MTKLIFLQFFAVAGGAGTHDNSETRRQKVTGEGARGVGWCMILKYDSSFGGAHVFLPERMKSPRAWCTVACVFKAYWFVSVQASGICGANNVRVCSMLTSI